MGSDDASKTQTPAGAAAGAALLAKGEDRKLQLEKAAIELRIEMEQAAERIRALILAHPPTSLLGYLWSRFFMGALQHHQKKGKGSGPDQDLIKQFQFALEYVHAVWSCHAGAFAEGQVDEAKVAQLFEECESLSMKAMFYAMASSELSGTSEFGDMSSTVEFEAKSSWILIRGHRHQVLEDEFFRFVLAPHRDALQRAYGIDASAVAEGIQAITDSIRGGYSDAVLTLGKRMEQSHALVEGENVELNAAIEKIEGSDPTFTAELGGAMRDLFFGGICNLSRHTKLPETILQDLAYEPGAEKEFFAEGDYCGTPYRTLPARIKPLVKLLDGYYATDGQFVRDSAYRAIQRGLIARLPDYREDWNKNQKTLIERAFPSLMASQLQGAQLFEEVYFKDSAGQWAETDLVGCVDDTLFVMEAKAGVMAMHSPATNFDRHIRTIRELVLKAYRQCKRFLEYLASGNEMPIYRLTDGKYEEVAKLRLSDFRRILPIGLTVEAFTPFSSMCKEIPEVAPILGAHPFISMSVDDLFVLNRFLPTTGELFHYLEVRQAVAGMPRAMMFDEIDHLGAYIVRNRFDQDMKEQLVKADKIAWDSFSDRIDRHFEQEDWQTAPVPRQDYPSEVADVLRVLDQSRPRGWLGFDAQLRDFNGSARDNLAAVLRDLKPTLSEHPTRRVIFGNENPIQIWLSRDKLSPNVGELRRQGEIACLAAKVPRVRVLILECNISGTFEGARCTIVTAPTIIRNDYAELAAEADRQRSRYISLDEKKRRDRTGSKKPR
ncbi:hypothetical protein [Mesorhizobium sp. NPDC059025]|uniref:hypothetical protein n=1 Tax=unclassified Mesorhizobium TaxID=325217 RepID=UPI0036C4645A